MMVRVTELLEKYSGSCLYEVCAMMLVNRIGDPIQAFRGGWLNMTQNCLDRHVIGGFGEQLAVIEESPVTNAQTSTLTYAELLHQVSLLSGYMARECGIRKGDHVLIYMPTIKECMIAMLATVRIGAIHTVVFGGFSSEQLARRISHVQPKMIITTSYGVERNTRIDYKASLENALEHSGSMRSCVKRCIILNRPNSQSVSGEKTSFYVDWNEAMEAGRPHDPIPVEANHPLYLLHTSGTTGDPKAIVRDTGGYATALQYSAEEIYDIHAGDVWWACSEFGWILGHSFCCYGPLLRRAVTVLHEGKPIGTPDAAQYFRIAAKHHVTGWFLTPTAIRAIRAEDPIAQLSQEFRTPNALEKLRNVFLAGEHCDIPTMKWFCNTLPSHIRLSETWWQTETGWPMTAACLGYTGGQRNQRGIILPLGSAGLPVPGYNVKPWSELSGDATVDEPISGDSKTRRLQPLVVKLPMPPGSFISLWKNDEKFERLYFQKYPGHYDSMDLGYTDQDGYVYILSRADDVINVAGHRLSTGALEEACLSVNGVVECAVIALPHSVKGHVPFGVLVIDRHCNETEQELIRKTILAVRRTVGPVAAFTGACFVPRLPKTRSGKISRASLSDMAAGRPIRYQLLIPYLFKKSEGWIELQVPSTIEDINVYEDIYEAFKKSGLKPSSL